MRQMELFKKAAKVLQGDTFDRRRVLVVNELYKRAKGKEKEMIGGLFESQYALADNPDDLDWLHYLKG